VAGKDESVIWLNKEQISIFVVQCVNIRKKFEVTISFCILVKSQVHCCVRIWSPTLGTTQ